MIVALTTLCRVLQQHHGPGRSWPLSCRMAGKILGVGRDKASLLLKLLLAEGIIELVTPGGSKGSKRAAEYRFLGS